jgi:uridylate kinase
VLVDGLRVLDAAAVSLCMENDLPIVVFDLDAHENILKAVRGETVGTLISKGGTR